MSWGYVAVGAATVIGGAISAKGSRDAASSQNAAAGAANQLSSEQYAQVRQDQAPWRQVGLGALDQISRGIGVNDAKTQENFDVKAYLAANPDVAADAYYGQRAYEHYIDAGQADGRAFAYTPEAQARMAEGEAGQESEFNRSFTLADFQKDPGYDFRLNQGLDAVQGSRAARGSMLSGATLKALNDYGSDYASSEYGKAYDRFNNDRTQRFNRLATVAGIGQTATNNVGTAGANMTSQVGSNIIGAGNAQAAGQVGQANAINSGISNLQSLYQLNQMNKSGSGSGTPVGYYEGSATGPVYVP